MGAMRLPAKVEAGQPVSAAAFNQLVEALAAAQVEAGPGLALDVAGGRVILSLADGSIAQLVRGIITGVNGQDGDLVEGVTYDAAAIGKSGASLVNATPRYGRLYAAGVACVPARVGDICTIVRSKDESNALTADLWVYSERYLVRRCGDGGGIREALQRMRDAASGRAPANPPPPPPPPSGGGVVIGQSSHNPGGGGFGEF